jgi:formate dehydrogenase subunit delta
MTTDPSAKLVKMANQIGQFFAGQGDEASAVAGVADHIRKNWPAAMRAALVQRARDGGAGLSPLARQAALKLEG